MANIKISDLVEQTNAGTDDFVEIVDTGLSASRKLSLANLKTAININVVEDTTPQLGGNLDSQTNNITDVGTLLVGVSSYSADGGSPVAVFSSGLVDRAAVFVSSDSGAYASFKDNSTTLDYGVRVGAIGDTLAVDANSTQVALLSDVFSQFNNTVGSDAEYDNGNSSTADTIDFDNGNFQKSTLTGNCTFTFTAPTGPCRVQLKLIQDGTGNRTVTWPTINWPGGTAPTLSTAAASVDIVTIYYDGSAYYGVGSLDFS